MPSAHGPDEKPSFLFFSPLVPVVSFNAVPGFRLAALM
jgi:hypothetical protein